MVMMTEGRLAMLEPALNGPKHSPLHPQRLGSAGVLARCRGRAVLSWVQALAAAKVARQAGAGKFRGA